jgi:hypothetical protein
MKAVIEIKMDNAAFDNGNSSELSWILAQLSRKVREKSTWHTGDKMILRDANGNKVGLFEITNT